MSIEEVIEAAGQVRSRGRYRGDHREDEDHDLTCLARKVGVSPATLSKVRRILKYGNDDLIEAIQDETISINAAERMIKGAPKKGRVALYRHYDVDGNLLYVGISDEPRKRFKAHALGSSWVDLAATFTGEWYHCRMEAEEAEEKAIKKEKPIFNVKRAH